MTEDEKLKRAYDIYKEGLYNINLIPSQLEKEFETYHVSKEQLKIWNNIDAKARYDEALQKIRNEEYDSNKEILSILVRINVFLSKSIISIDSLKKLYDIIELTFEKGIFVKFFAFYDQSSGYFSELLILTDYWRSKVKDSPYYYGDEFAGVIPYLYHIKEYDLYNRLFKMVMEALKINGNEFQEMFRDLISFTAKYNDKDNHKLALEALDYCKKNTVMTVYSKKWII